MQASLPTRSHTPGERAATHQASKLNSTARAGSRMGSGTDGSGSTRLQGPAGKRGRQVLCSAVLCAAVRSSATTQGFTGMPCTPRVACIAAGAAPTGTASRASQRRCCGYAAPTCRHDSGWRGPQSFIQLCRNASIISLCCSFGEDGPNPPPALHQKAGVQHEAASSQAGPLQPPWGTSRSAAQDTPECGSRSPHATRTGQPNGSLHFKYPPCHAAAQGQENCRQREAGEGLAHGNCRRPAGSALQASLPVFPHSSVHGTPAGTPAGCLALQGKGFPGRPAAAAAQTQLLNSLGRPGVSLPGNHILQGVPSGWRGPLPRLCRRQC